MANLCVKEILKTLKNNNVCFVLIGGLGAVAQGLAYPTYDFDLCYSRDKENLKNIVKALSPYHPYLRCVEKDLPFIFDAETLKNGLNFTFTTDIGNIDLIGEVQGIGNYDEVIKYSETMDIYGVDCHVLTIEGLLKSKKAIARPKDIIHIMELEAILEIRKRLSDRKIP